MHVPVSKAQCFIVLTETGKSERGLVHVSKAQTSTVCRRAVRHGDAVAVQQICQPLLPGSTPRVSLKRTARLQSAPKHPHSENVHLSSTLCVLCFYREVQHDLLQQSGISQQLVVEWRVLQHHGEDLSELRKLLLVHVCAAHGLQNHSQQARDSAQRCNATTPNRLPANVVKTHR